MARHAPPDRLETTQEDLIEIKAAPDGSLEIIHRWTPFPNPVAAFTGVTVALAVFFYWLESMIVGAPFWVVLTYAFATVCFNATRLTVDSQTLRWSHGPLPFRPGGKAAVEEVAAIAHGRAIAHSGPSSRQSTTPRIRYAVWIESRAGKQRNVFRDILSREAVAQIATAIANRTAIPSKEVALTDPNEFSQRTYLFILVAVVVCVAGLVYVLATVSP